MRLSTTSSLDQDADTVLIHVLNIRLYGTLSMKQQMDDTIAMLEAEAEKINAADVMGVRFDRIWSPDRNGYLMAAYGTAIIRL